MKKCIYSILFLIIIFFFVAPIAKAEDKGSLQLDPNVITNGGGSSGDNNDFPIRGELFSESLNQISNQAMQDHVLESRKSVNFSSRKENLAYSMNTSAIQKKLFVNYQPTALIATTSKNNVKTSLGFWLIGFLSIPLIALAVFLGRSRGKRSEKRRRGKQDERTNRN